jgi:protein MpaA
LSAPDPDQGWRVPPLVALGLVCLAVIVLVRLTSPGESPIEPQLPASPGAQASGVLVDAPTAAASAASAVASRAASGAASGAVMEPPAVEPPRPEVAAAAASTAAPAAGTSAASAAAPRMAQAAPQVVSDPCTALVKRMPNLSAALCAAAELKPSGAHSVQGFPLYQRDIDARPHEVSGQATQTPLHRPRVLVVGGIHGDELSSTSLVFHWIALARETGAEMDWRFVPALNPDGLLSPKPSRMNARGVDLNRNFPTPNWHRDAPEYWAKRTKNDPRRYPGPEPLSEPETVFLQETMDSWKPDLIVSVHAPYGVLDYDGPSIPPERLGRLFLDRVGIFPGSLGHYGGVHRGVPVVTIELKSANSTPTSAEMRQMWIDLLRWIGERLMQYQQPGR